MNDARVIDSNNMILGTCNKKYTKKYSTDGTPSQRCRLGLEDDIKKEAL
jgi:hypothetical protein